MLLPPLNEGLALLETLIVCRHRAPIRAGRKGYDAGVGHVAQKALHGCVVFWIGTNGVFPFHLVPTERTNYRKER